MAMKSKLLEMSIRFQPELRALLMPRLCHWRTSLTQFLGAQQKIVPGDV
jgi:hypothetical protein